MNTGMRTESAQRAGPRVSWACQGCTELKGAPSRGPQLCESEGKCVPAVQTCKRGPGGRRAGPRPWNDSVRSRAHVLIQLGCALPFCFLKRCFPENSSRGQISLSLFLSWSFWNKLFQRRNGHIAVLPFLKASSVYFIYKNF